MPIDATETKRSWDERLGGAIEQRVLGWLAPKVHEPVKLTLWFTTAVFLCTVMIAMLNPGDTLSALFAELIGRLALVIAINYAIVSTLMLAGPREWSAEPSPTEFVTLRGGLVVAGLVAVAALWTAVIAPFAPGNVLAECALIVLKVLQLLVWLLLVLGAIAMLTGVGGDEEAAA